MIDQHQFHENIEIWAQSNPQAAVFLHYTDNQTTKPVDSPETIAKWFSELKLKDVDILYVYGIGHGEAYEAARKWLSQSAERALIFLEDDLAAIRFLLETERGSAILRDPQVQLHYFENMENRTSTLNELYWNFLTTRIAVEALPTYRKEKAERFSELSHKLVYDATVCHAVLQEYLQYGLPFYHNFYPNMYRLPGASIGDALAGNFQGVPAIICGAGPSLTKHLQTLKGLRDRALIFAGGSALNALNAENIQPHLGAGVDPNPDQLDRLSRNTAFEVPFLYRNRLENRAFQLVHGPRLYITGSGGYDTAQWFEERLGIKGTEIDEGFNVVNFCIDIARVWGCNPIIFVGMDLAYTEMQSYAQGVITNASVKEKELLESPDLDVRALQKPDINGNPVYTLWKWIAESQWIGDFAKAHTELSFINATEGGIGFPDVPNMALSEVISKYLSNRYELESRLHGEIQDANLTEVTEQDIEALLQELLESLLRSHENIETLMSEADKLIGRIQTEKKLPAMLQSGLAALSEIELADEVGYRYVLNIFNVVYSKVLNKELRQIYKSLEDLPDWQKAMQKMLINNKKLAFLRDVARANITLLQHTLQERLKNKRIP